MRLLQRVMKLERNQMFRRRGTVLSRFDEALDEAALQLAGCKYAGLVGDQVTMVLDAAESSFVTTLTESELAELMREVERMAFGNDGEALERARAEVLAELV